MTDWAQLRDVYGSAKQVPALLSPAAASDDGPVWDELWGRLRHQGTVAEASYAALPFLAAMSRARLPAGYVPALHLAAGIVASEDGPAPAEVVRARYEAELADLRDVAERCLSLAADDVEFACVAGPDGVPRQADRGSDAAAPVRHHGLSALLDEVRVAAALA